MEKIILSRILFFAIFIFCFAFLVQRNNFVTAQTNINAAPSGWDYNLTHRCVKSINPQGQNYYQDLTDCPGGKNWTIAVESEKQLGVPDPGPADQSFSVNGTNSPVTLNWLRHTDEFGNPNWSVELKTDFNQYTHPGGTGHFTWVAFMDHADNNGGPLPRPDQLSFSSTVDFNDSTPNGATRAIAGFQGYWNGKAHMVDINFAQTNWGDAHPDPDVINYQNTSSLEFIDLYGPAMGISVPKLKDTKITVAWADILKNLVARGLLENPAGGWQNSAAQTVYIATEVNNFSATNSAVADLWFTNFRVEQTAAKNCVPSNCASLNYACGSASDGCGATLSCGACAAGQACTGNKCIATCVPKNCAALGYACGSQTNGCGGPLACGTCTIGQTCNANGQCEDSAGSSDNTSSGPSLITEKPVTDMSRTEILAAIEQIKTLIAGLQKQLAAMTGDAGTTFSCTRITKNLFYQTTNDPQAVRCLQEVLKRQGYPVAVSGNYDVATKTAVAQFQQKYASEILAPYHLQRGSGNVGNATLAKLNAIISITH